LEHVLGIPLPAGEAIGETWELFDRADGSSRLRGTASTVADLMRESAAELLGRGVAPGHAGRFPLLLKFLDARDALSVQVHPDEAQARAEGDGGKHEASIVLHAGPQARIVRGLRPGVDPAEFRAKAHEAAVEPLLWSFAPRTGDCVEFPAGTVHALGPDVVLFEIQQNSDVTFRLYDWGRPRPVQVQKALAVARFDAGGGGVERPVVAPIALPDGGVQLVANEYFRVRRYDLRRPLQFATQRRFAVVTVVGGRGVLGWHSGGADVPLPLVAGDTVLVPAAVENVFLSPVGRLDVLVSDPGER
jgi:mannose-6-phosphate isomerase